MAAMKLFSAATLAIGLIAVNAVDAADVNYHLVKTIPVGGDGGWDYLSVDSAAQRLYVSHGTEVVVIDLAKDTVAGEITKTLEILAKVDTGANPDGMLYEPGRREFYTFNGRGQSATVIDARTQKVVATIPLGGKPEFAQADAKAGLVFDNLEDQSEVAVIDTKTHSVTNRWPIAPGEEASGMALDEKNHRLFLGCGNQRMVMLDSTSGKVLASVPIGGGVDANAFDPATQLAFASCGDGTVTIAHEEGDTLTVVQTLPTEKGARTMTIDPATHKIYLASAKFDAPAAGQRRGKMVAGSFKILIYGMDK